MSILCIILKVSLNLQTIVVDVTLWSTLISQLWVVSSFISKYGTPNRNSQFVGLNTLVRWHQKWLLLLVMTADLTYVVRFFERIIAASLSRLLLGRIPYRHWFKPMSVFCKDLRCLSYSLISIISRVLSALIALSTAFSFLYPSSLPTIPHLAIGHFTSLRTKALRRTVSDRFWSGILYKAL